MIWAWDKNHTLLLLFTDSVLSHLPIIYGLNALLKQHIHN